MFPESIHRVGNAPTAKHDGNAPVLDLRYATSLVVFPSGCPSGKTRIRERTPPPCGVGVFPLQPFPCVPTVGNVGNA